MSVFNQDVLPAPTMTGHMHSLCLRPCSRSAPNWVSNTKILSSNYICFNLGLTGRESIMKQAVEAQMLQRLVLALQC